MPFSAALTHGTVALLEGQESLQGCSHLIMSLLALSPRAHGLSRVCLQSERLLWQNAIESQLSLHAACCGCSGGIDGRSWLAIPVG